MFKKHQLLCVLHHCFWHSSTDINTPRVNNLQHCLVLSWTQLTTCRKSPSCKANSSSAKKFPTFYGTKGSLSCWQEPVTCPYHALPLHFFTNHLTVVPLSMSTSCVCSFLKVFPLKHYTFLFSLTRITCPAHFMVLNVITWICDEKYKPWSF